MNAAKIRRFWDWFSARAESLRLDPGRHEPEISEMVHGLDEDLVWELGRGEGGRSEFIVRTDHSTRRYLANTIVRSAPSLPGWFISDWRQPSSASQDFEIRLGDRKGVRVGDCTAALTTRLDFPLLNLTLVSGQFEGNPADSEAGYLVLDNLLGEKVVEDVFDTISFKIGPPARIPAGRLRDEVTALLAKVRARSSLGSDKWAQLKGEDDGKPVAIVMAVDLDPARMEKHPWRLDVGWRLKDPGENGLATSEELNTLQELDDRLIALLEEHASTLPWCHRTTDGVRTTSVYLDEPALADPLLRDWLRESAYESTVTVDYDPRWREYRDYRPQG